MRIVLIGSETGALDLLDFVLRDSGHETVVVPSEEGLHEAIDQQTDVVFIRADIQGIDGCRCCMELRARGCSDPIIFVSQKRAMREKVRAFDHGADDYIIEPYNSLELMARMNAVVRRCRMGDSQSSGDVLTVGDLELSFGAQTVTVGDEPPTLLTPTEMRILECLMRSPEMTISRETLIERTWGYDFVGEGNRLDVNILRLRRKLESDPANPRYLHTVRGAGYAIRPSSPRESANLSLLSFIEDPDGVVDPV
ncbi:MAG TPA: response regulator transcription factor [Nitrolancea sp.]|jgi:DNA-binding response OmpR family regulator|nr:response regulator transcription factor [Nitrolancea sp.]